jgi:serine phosphatase RsbU (regulator of sigma subunit)
VVLYTDGVTESNNCEGKAFAHKRLQRVLYDCRTQDPHRILELILNELVAHSALGSAWGMMEDSGLFRIPSLF